MYYFRLSLSFTGKLIASFLEDDSRGTYLHNTGRARLFENKDILEDQIMKGDQNLDHHKTDRSRDRSLHRPERYWSESQQMVGSHILALILLHN